MSYNSDFVDQEGGAATAARSYLDWPAIFGGIVLASAISIVLLAFGSGLGLSVGDFTSKGAAFGTGTAAAIWFLWVEVSSFMTGAYLTGRLRGPVVAKSLHETEMRDGAHGLVVWAGCVVLGTVLAFSGGSTLLKSGGAVIKTATEVAGTTVQGATPSAMQYYSDTLLRPTSQASSGPKADRETVGIEINSILARTALAAPTDEDKAYLAQAVSQQTGVSPDDAKTRVEKVYADLAKAKANAAKAAETARQIGVISAFLLAASLVVSAAGAFWAATEGGSHRDEGAVFEGFFRRTNPRR